jgi:hypothetical protein
MPYRYIITNTFEGRVEGTNDEQTARDLAESEDYFVADALTGRWLQPRGVESEIMGRG